MTMSQCMAGCLAPQRMDPQQRKLLEVTYEAIIDSGEDTDLTLKTAGLPHSRHATASLLAICCMLGLRGMLHSSTFISGPLCVSALGNPLRRSRLPGAARQQPCRRVCWQLWLRVPVAVAARHPAHHR